MIRPPLLFLMPKQMKTCLLPLIFTILSAPLLPAATADTLELKASGDIFVQTDTLGELQIYADVQEKPQDRWVQVYSKQKTAPTSGKEVEGEMTYPFADGSATLLTIKATIDHGNVIAKATWASDGTPKGFVRVNLKIPFDAAGDLTIESEGKPLFTGFDIQPINIPRTSELAFRRKSTGAFLFKLTGEFGGLILFNPDKLEDGLTLRIDTLQYGGEPTINDVKEAGWTLSFKE